jgi:hypothetical protein
MVSGIEPIARIAPVVEKSYHEDVTFVLPALGGR